MPRVTTYQDSLPYIADPSTLVRDMGRDIDWSETGSATKIPGGTAMVLLASGKMCPRATAPGAETAVGILMSSADQNDRTGTPGHALILGGTLFENLLASYSDASWATFKTELDAAGVFTWMTYGDDRVV